MLPRRKTSSRSASPGFTVPKWFYFVVLAMGALAASVGAVIVVGARNARNGVAPGSPKPPALGTATIATTSTASPPGAVTGAGTTTTPPAHADDGFAAILHGHGAETPQLRALLDAQDRLVQACRNDAAACGRGWTPRARDALAPIDKASLVFTPPPEGPLPAWLRDLKMPSDFPVHDEPALRSPFDYGTKNIAGRQGFQSKLFQCSAYTDIFDSTLLKYGAPHWLSAVVYQESGCNPSIESPVGAKGLWQFMPESARAYGLRVVDGEIDERLNPIKSTDAAIHFLTDLQRKLGAWDLALAGYNMGPYAVLARLTEVGEKAGFWELAHAGLLPDETATYVPSIEAYALMLQNLNRLQFNPYGKRLESTAEVIVKPGTRLSLIARASSTTTVHIRDLNPEFLRDVVPDGETTARVPDSEAYRAQSRIDSWSPTDNRDTCVPPDFDWGAQPFENSRFAKTCASAATQAP